MSKCKDCNGTDACYCDVVDKKPFTLADVMRSKQPQMKKFINNANTCNEHLDLACSRCITHNDKIVKDVLEETLDILSICFQAFENQPRPDLNMCETVNQHHLKLQKIIKGMK